MDKELVKIKVNELSNKKKTPRIDLHRDGHIHSPYCPHGTTDSFRSYIEKALEMGLKEMTFTEHMPLPGPFMDPDFLAECSPTTEVIEAYFKELEQVKESFKRQIKINTGLEVDYIEGYEEQIKDLLNTYGPKLEDGLLSVHFIKIKDTYYCIDASPELFGEIVAVLGSIEAVYDAYYESLLKAIQADLGPYKPKRIGHPTLVRRFQEKFPLDYKNKALLEKIMIALREGGFALDYNTAGLRKKYCGEKYPSGLFKTLVEEYQIEGIYGSDSHTALDVGRDFK